MDFEYVYIEFDLAVSIAIRIEEQFSIQEGLRNMPASIQGLDSHEYQWHVRHRQFLYYADATVYQDPRLRQHTFDLLPYKEDSNMRSF
jgi:hypothetical protein